MIKSLKHGIKLLKYTYKLKQSVFVCMIFFVVGLAFLLELGRSSISCSIYWLTVGMIATGTCFTVNTPSIVQSSPLKRTLQISIPVVLNLSCHIMTYLLFLLLEVLLWTVGGRERDPGALVIYGLMAIVFMVYNSSYKIFELVTVFFIVAFLSLLLGGEYLIRQMLAGLSPAIAAVIGFGEILIGALLQYCLALLTYRMPLSMRAIARELRKWMKWM